MLFDAMDLGATFVFAISGATRGVRRRLDLFGGLVVAWAAAVAGGLARDLLIGAVPPASIADWRYLAAAVAAGLLGFFASDWIGRLRTPVLLFDAAGLCLFAVTGTQKALAYGLDPVMAAVLGMITCIGGGVARDLTPCRCPRCCAPSSMPWPPWPARARSRSVSCWGCPRCRWPCLGPGCAFSCD